jgi:hypothetical protein
MASLGRKHGRKHGSESGKKSGMRGGRIAEQEDGQTEERKVFDLKKQQHYTLASEPHSGLGGHGNRHEVLMLSLDNGGSDCSDELILEWAFLVPERKRQVELHRLAYSHWKMERLPGKNFLLLRSTEPTWTSLQTRPLKSNSRIHLHSNLSNESDTKPRQENLHPSTFAQAIAASARSWKLIKAKPFARFVSRSLARNTRVTRP